MSHLLCVFFCVSFGGQLEVGDLYNAYMQNRAFFTPVSLETEWERQIPSSYKKSLELEKSFLKNELRDPAKRREFLAKLQSGGLKVTESELDSFVLSRFSDEVKEPPERRTHEYAIGSVYEIRDFQPDVDRRNAAVAASIESFTGGEYRQIQSLDGGTSWTCLEPYPLKGQRLPVVWKRSSGLSVRVVPPFCEAPGIQPTIVSELYTFWANRDSVAGPVAADKLVQPEELSLFQLVLPDSGEVLIAAFKSSPAVGLPEWLCRVTHSQLLASNQLKATANAVWSLKEGKPAVIGKAAIAPSTAVYYVNKRFDQSYIPVSLTHVVFARVRTESTSNVLPDERQLGWSMFGKLSITNLKYGQEARIASPMEIPSNASVFDFDTNEGYIKGEQADSAYKRLTKRVSNSSGMLICVNLLVFAILGFVLWRKFGASRK